MALSGSYSGLALEDLWSINACSCGYLEFMHYGNYVVFLIPVMSVVAWGYWLHVLLSEYKNYESDGSDGPFMRASPNNLPFENDI